MGTGLHCHCTKSHFCPLSTVYYGNLDDLYDVNNNKTCPAILQKKLVAICQRNIKRILYEGCYIAISSIHFLFLPKINLHRVVYQVCTAYCFSYIALLLWPSPPPPPFEMINLERTICQSCLQPGSQHRFSTNCFSSLQSIILLLSI